MNDLKPLTAKGVGKLAEERGYTTEFCEELSNKGIIGAYEGKLAFPVEDGFHFRSKDGSWRYDPPGIAKPSLFVLGEIEEGANVHCFESQWDAIAFAGITGERNNIVATRGASNAKLLIPALSEHTGSIYLWPQNDEPGRKWADDLRRLLPDEQIKVAAIPKEHKDFNDWTKAGAEASEVLFAWTVQSNDFPVSVLAEPKASGEELHPARASSEVGEARESASAPNSSSTMAATDSRGGKNICERTGEAQSRPALPQGERDHPAQISNNLSGSEKANSQPPSGEGANRTVGRADDARANPEHETTPPAQNNLPEVGVGEKQPQPEMPVSASTLAPAKIIALSCLSLAQTLDEIETFFLKYVRFPEPWHVTVCTLWAAYTWVWKAFNRTPYLLIRGPEENCGKTRVLDCLLALAPSVYGGEIVASTSESSLYHEIHNSKPVLLLDEIDESFANGQDDPIVKVLNSGYRRGGSVTRWNIKTGKPDVFDIFCPKAFAGIANNMKTTLSSRCIHIHMARQSSDDMAAPFREGKAPDEVRHIRTFLLGWSGTAVDMLRGIEPTLPDELANDGRKAEITEPLIAVADMAGVEWAARAREDLVCAFDQPRDDSDGTKLLRAIKSILLTRNLDRISSHELVERLVSDSEGPWSAWWERDLGAGRWHGAAYKINKMLKPYRVHSKDVRIGPDVLKGYDRGDFERAWKTYLSSEVKAIPMELFKDE